MVGGGFAGLNAEMPLYLFEHLRGAPNVAGGALADHHSLSAQRREAELRVEGGDAEHVTLGDAREAGDPEHRLFREVAQFRLDFLEYLDQFASLALVVGEDFLYGPIDILRSVQFALLNRY